MSEDNKNGKHVFSEETRKKLKKRGSICMIIGLICVGLAEILKFLIR